MYQPWWYDKSPSERHHDLVAAEKTYGNEHETLESAEQEIIEKDPDQEAFVNEYREDSWGMWEMVDEHEDPRLHENNT